jgi:hypothetical protein
MRHHSAVRSGVSHRKFAGLLIIAGLAAVILGFFAYPREKVQSRFTRASVRLVGALINSRMIASTFRTSGCFWNS